MNYSAFKDNLGYFVLIALLIKLMAFGFNIADSLAALALLIFASGLRVFDYMFPKRPDLYADLESLKADLKQLVIKNEELERNVTALKIERVRR